MGVGGGGTRTKKQQTGGEDGTVDPHRGRPIITVSLEKKRVEARREGRTKMKHGRRFLTFRQSFTVVTAVESDLLSADDLRCQFNQKTPEKRKVPPGRFTAHPRGEALGIRLQGVHFV